MDCFNKIINNLGEPIPLCIQSFLCECGFTTLSSIRGINTSSVVEIENHIQSYGSEMIRNLSCCFSKIYNAQERFKLLPGHRAFILELPKYLSECEQIAVNPIDQSFSFVLQEIIKTAQLNFGKGSNNHVFNDKMRYFSTYVFLLCGRSCYEFLRQNLPLPSVRTVCKFEIQEY